VTVGSPLPSIRGGSDSVGLPAGGLPELVVEGSPAAVDVALLEGHVAPVAAADAGLVEEQKVAIFARQDDGQTVVGICGIVWGSYCELQAMWVAESLRNRGLGGTLGRRS